MKKEPMVFAVVGLLFGFVLGYMVAGATGAASGPRPGGSRVVGGSEPAGLPAGSGTGVGVPARGEASAGHERGGPVDPDEVRALESLAAKEAGNVQVRVDLGNLYMDHRRLEEAARWYREALALKPDALDVRVDLGASLVDGGHAEEGLKEFEAALKVEPTHKKALYNKGVALMQLGRAKDAVAVWEDLLKRYPDDAQLAPLKEQIAVIRSQKRGGAP